MFGICGGCVYRIASQLYVVGTDEVSGKYIHIHSFIQSWRHKGKKHQENSKESIQKITLSILILFSRSLTQN